jgi:hypothetical protein
VYAEETESPPDKTLTALLTRESLLSLPQTLLDDMHRAVKDGDIVELEGLIARIRAIDAGTAGKLWILAKQYDYDTLDGLLSRQGGVDHEP